MSNTNTAALPVGSGSCSCVLSQHGVKLVVLTGGPGAGKTAVLEMARRSFCRHIAILPEAAGIVFGGGFPRAQHLASRRAAQRAIYHVQRELESIALTIPDQIAVALCDRGTVDGAAYWPEGAADYWSQFGTSVDRELARYAAAIHLRTPSATSGFDHSNPLRRESAEEAAELDARIARCWSTHPHRFEVPSSVDFVEKARVVLRLVRDELPDCCHVHDLKTQ